MSVESNSSSGSFQQDDFGDGSTGEIKDLLEGLIQISIREDGSAAGAEVDRVGNNWNVQVRGEPDAVTQFATQNNNAPIQYRVEYSEGDDSGDPLPTSRGDSPAPRGSEYDENVVLDISVSLDLSAQPVDETGFVNLELTIDPPIAHMEQHRYRIEVKQHAGAMWYDFSVRYSATGEIDVIPLSAALQEVENFPSLTGTLTAAFQAVAYEFSVNGMHPAGSFYRLFSRGRIRLHDVG